jgi:RNA polymerase sigma-70 factor (ECF subfamily)
VTLRALRVDGEDRASAEVRFEALYEMYFASVSAYCRRRVLAERVDDVVAETFLTAWRRIDEVPAGERALFWLYGVAYRVVGRQWRSGSRRRRLEARLAAVPATAMSTPEDDALHGDEVRRVLEASARLNDRDSEILRLLSWEQLSRVEIADVLGIAPNAVSQRVHRARANLTKEYNRLERRSDRTPAAWKGGTP